MASQSFICIIILPPNAQKQMFFYDKSSFSSKDEAKKASYYYAVLELNKAGCFTKNLKPCNVDLMRINLEDEDDENIEKDFVYKENFKKYVKSISRRDNESSKPHTIHFYPRINEEVFKFNYMKDNLFYEANEWNFYLYSIEISMEDFEIENKNKSKNKLGLIYFSDILKDFSRTLCEKNHNQIGYFSLKLITKSINLKETFERLYKVYQFLEITKKSWTYKYISSFIASKNQEIKTNMSFKLKQMESSLLFVILKEDNTIDWNKYDEIDKHIEILTKFHEREQISLDTKKNCQNHDNSNLNNEKFEINSIITNIKSCCNGIIKDIIKNKPDGNNLKNSSFSQAQEISIIIEGLKKSMSFENSSTLSYQKTNIQGFIIFPLDYLFMKNFFTIMNNLYAIRDFLLSLVFKEVLQRMEENRKQFCQVSERKKTWDFSFWAINHEKFCNFLTEKYPYILKLKKNTKKFQTSFNPNFDNTQIDQSFEKKNYLFSDNISSKITLTELMIKTIDYDCLDNNSPFIEIGGSIINFLVTISCFLKKKKKDNYKDYAEMVSERSKYKYNTFSHHVIVSKQFYQYLLNKHLPLPVTTLVNNSKKNNHSYLPCQYIEATRKEHTDFLRGLIGIYYHTFDKDIMVCQKILWELEIVDSPGYRIIQEGKFILDKNSKLYGHFKTLLEYYEFKNHGLLIQAFSSRNLMQKINEFFLKDKGLQDDMSFLIKAFDYSGDKSKDDTIVSEIYKLKEAEKIVNSIEANNFLNERFVFLGEGLIEFLIHDHLLESYNEKDSSKIFFLTIIIIIFIFNLKKKILIKKNLKSIMKKKFFLK